MFWRKHLCIKYKFYKNLISAVEFIEPLNFLCEIVVCALEFNAPLKFLCNFVICAEEFKAPFKFLFDFVHCAIDFNATHKFLCNFVMCAMEFKAPLKFLFIVKCGLDIYDRVYFRPKMQPLRFMINTTRKSSNMIVKNWRSWKTEKIVWRVKKLSQKIKQSHLPCLWYSAFISPQNPNFGMKAWTYLLENLKRHVIAVYMDTGEKVKDSNNRSIFYVLEVSWGLPHYSPHHSLLVR